MIPESDPDSYGLRPDLRNEARRRAEREAMREAPGPSLDPPFPYVVETPAPEVVERTI